MNDATRAQFETEAIAALLSEDDIEALRADLTELGPAGWLEWAERHYNEANDFLQSTEKQRARMQKSQEPARFLRLVLAACSQSMLAGEVLAAADKLAYRGDKRSLLAFAAQQGTCIGKGRVQDMLAWPFLSHDPPPGWHLPSWLF